MGARIARRVIPPEPTDGVVRLRTLTRADAAEHLAGEDEELWRWLSGSPATLEIVEDAIKVWQDAWRDGARIRNFGVWDAATGLLAGNVEANFLQEMLATGEVNISYAIWPAFRGRGYATRAVDLLCTHLADTSDAHTAVVRVDPENDRSLAVARRGGFVEVVSAEPQYRRLARPLRPG